MSNKYALLSAGAVQYEDYLHVALAILLENDKDTYFGQGAPRTRWVVSRLIIKNRYRRLLAKNKLLILIDNFNVYGNNVRELKLIYKK